MDSPRTGRRYSSRTVIYIALGANLLVAATKFAAADWTGSSAMFSEGVHSLVDTGNELLLLYGLHRGAARPDQDHPLAAHACVHERADPLHPRAQEALREGLLELDLLERHVLVPELRKAAFQEVLARRRREPPEHQENTSREGQGEYVNHLKPRWWRSCELWRTRWPS